MAWMSMLLGFTALAAALPVGGAGGLAAAGVVGFAGFVLVALLKYLLLEAMYLLLPLIAVLWLFPGTRHVARSMANIIVALMVWNLVLAAMVGLSARALASPANASPLEVIGYGVAMPLAMLASGPAIAGLVGAPLPGAGLFATVWGRLGAAVAARLGLQQAAATAALAPPGAVVGTTEYLRPPIHPTSAPAAPGGAWQPAAWSGTPMATTVPSHTAASHPHTTYLKPAAGPAATGQPQPPRPAPSRVHDAGRELSGGWTPGPGEVAETAKAVERAAVPQKPPRIEEVPTGRKWEAVRAAGAALGRLEAYFENRARQFIREFATAFEARTGIKVPERLKAIRQLDRLDIETRKYIGARYAEQAAQAGAKLGKTIYIRIKRSAAEPAMRQRGSGTISHYDT